MRRPNRREVTGGYPASVVLRAWQTVYLSLALAAFVALLLARGADDQQSSPGLPGVMLVVAGPAIQLYRSRKQLQAPLPRLQLLGEGARWPPGLVFLLLFGAMILISFMRDDPTGSTIMVVASGACFLLLWRVEQLVAERAGRLVLAVVRRPFSLWNSYRWGEAGAVGDTAASPGADTPP